MVNYDKRPVIRGPLSRDPREQPRLLDDQPDSAFVDDPGDVDTDPGDS